MARLRMGKGGQEEGDELRPHEGPSNDFPVPEQGPALGSELVGGFGPGHGRGGETPRERGAMGGGVYLRGGAGVPKRPSEPTPMAGSTFSTGSSESGVLPFKPMGGASGGLMASPKLRGLYGSTGGLQGGGLGMPLDPVSNQMSDPISSLIQMLMGKKGPGL